MEQCGNGQHYAHLAPQKLTGNVQMIALYSFGYCPALVQQGNKKGTSKKDVPFQCVVGSSTWARTRDLRINSPSLYRLSYRGMNLIIIDASILYVKHFNKPTYFWFLTDEVPSLVKPG